MVRATQPQYNLRAELAKLKNEPGRKVSSEFIAEIEAHLESTDNPHGVTAAQVGALGLGGGTLTGPIVKDGPGDWGRYKSDAAGQSYASYRKHDGSALGYLGNEASLFSGGSADKFGMRSEGDLFLLAGGESAKATLHASGALTVLNQPAFSAYGLTSVGSGVIVFDVPYTNTGNCYNPTNGTFTAPVDGSYFFGASVLLRTSASNTAYGYLIFQKNGVDQFPYIHSQNNVSRSYEPLTLTGLCYLNEGDTVRVRLEVGNGAENYSAVYSGFSGFMIG